MQRVIVPFVVLWCVLLLGVTHAEVITIDGTIKSVDAAKRTITVETEGKEKMLDVSSKVKISVEGKDANLDALKEGQKVKLSYHDELEIVLKIDVGKHEPKPVAGAAELVEIAELLAGPNASFPWVSPDGLTIYWEGWHPEGAFTWMAHRDDAESFFKDKQQLFKGRHPTVTADGLEMLLLVDGVLHTTARVSLDLPFKRPSLIRELKDQPQVKNPCISADGLKLYFNRHSGDSGSEFVVATRRSRDSKWTNPKHVPIQKDGLEGNLTWLSLSNDRYTLLCSHEETARIANGEATLMVWTRGTEEEAFSNYQYIKFPGMDALIGRSPRYVAATNELFFTRLVGEDQAGNKRWGIWVVKNFDLSTFTK